MSGADGILRDAVGAAADRRPGEAIGPNLLKILPGQNHALAAGGARKIPGQKDGWLLEVHDDRGRILDLDLFERRLRWPRGGPRPWDQEAVDAELHVLRRERRAIVKRHASAVT